MAKFLAMKIIDGSRKYAETVTRYPQYKPGIDAYLNEQGHSDLITQ